jgi:hypothetical protein
MNFLKTAAGPKQWSFRSQRSCLQQAKLEQQRKRCEDLIHYCERSIGELEKSKEAQLKAQMERRAGSAQFLGRTLTELAEENAKVAAYKERRAFIQSQVDALANVSPSEAAQRAERQAALARLVADRLEKDRELGAALKQFRQLLAQRAELSAKVTQAASAVEITVKGDGLDEERFKALLDSLPAEVAGASERWAVWFLGKQEKARPYVVVVDELMLPETLARAGFYRFGDKVELAEDEAGELTRDVCPLGRARHDLGWTYEPPRIMPLEAFEALLREAADQGETAQGVVSRRNGERQAKLLKQYELEYREAVRQHEDEMRAKGLLIGGTRTTI